MEDIDVNRMAQRVHRSYYEDGIAEILIGFFLVFTGGMLVTEAKFVAFVAFGVFILRFLAERLKKRFVYPRIGYARLREEETQADAKGVLRGLLIFAGLIVATALIVWLVSGNVMLRSFWLMHVVPFFVGLLTAMGPIHAATRSGLRRWWVYAVLLIAGGLAFPFIFAGQGVYAVIGLLMTFVGALVFIVGLLVFIVWLRTHPLPEQDLSYDGA